MNYSDETADEMAKLQDEIDAATSGISTRRSSRPWTRSAARRAMRRSIRCQAARSGAWRSAACCWRSPTSSCSTSRPTISTPKAWPGSSIICATIPAPWSWSPTTATSSTTSPNGRSSSIAGQGIPYHGSYSSWLEQKHKRLEVEGKQDEAKERTLARELDWIRASPKARQAKSKARIKAYDELVAEAGRDTNGKAQITIPPGPRLGDIVIEAEDIGKGFGDRLLSTISPSSCRPAASSASSVRTAPARPRCSA